MAVAPTFPNDAAVLLLPEHAVRADCSSSASEVDERPVAPVLPNGEGAGLFDIPNGEGAAVPWAAFPFPKGDGEGVAPVPNGVDDVDAPK